MKFSILIPTRNRPELLKLAIRSVQLQDYQDWELIVSDNASDRDITGEMQSLGDSRIQYSRTGDLIPVTDNWNRALLQSSGDYFIMLGDDDVLTPGSLTEARRIIEKWNGPDAIYAQAHQYAYPGVVPGHAEAFVQTGYNAFIGASGEPFVLERATAVEMARQAAAFRILYGFNMQHFVISHGLAGRLAGKGPFFQSPYPDYYAANAVLLAGDPVVVSPRPLTMIGISPKSFGFYYVNQKEQEGVQFLQNRPEEKAAERVNKHLIAGSNMNDSWLCAMETLAANFQDHDIRVSYPRYRRLQHYEQWKSGQAGRLRGLLASVRPAEAVLYGFVAAAWLGTRLLPGAWGANLRARLFGAVFGKSPRFDPQRKTVPYQNILQAAFPEERSRVTPGV